MLFVKRINFLHNQMTVIAFVIIKYFRNFFCQLGINTKVSMSRTSICFCQMIMISLFIISPSVKNVLHMQHLLPDLKLFFNRQCEKIIKMLFTFFFKNCLNELIDYIFSSEINDLLAKSIIDTYNLISKTAGNMFLIYLGRRSIDTSIITTNFLKTDLKSA